jgi:hypothetical protein
MHGFIDAARAEWDGSWVDEALLRLRGLIEACGLRGIFLPLSDG